MRISVCECASLPLCDYMPPHTATCATVGCLHRFVYPRRATAEGSLPVQACGAGAYHAQHKGLGASKGWTGAGAAEPLWALPPRGSVGGLRRRAHAGGATHAKAAPEVRRLMGAPGPGRSRFCDVSLFVLRWRLSLSLFATPSCNHNNPRYSL